MSPTPNVIKLGRFESPHLQSSAGDVEESVCPQSARSSVGRAACIRQFQEGSTFQIKVQSPCVGVVETGADPAQVLESSLAVLRLHLDKLVRHDSITGRPNPDIRW